MNVETYAKCTEAAHRLIEAAAVAYYSFDMDQKNRHAFSAEQALKKIAEALGFTISRDGAQTLALSWDDIKTAPRDGRWLWLWNKHSNEPIHLRWSTHYSVFGLGGCWTDGLCTMGDGIDFDFWCEFLPADYANPHHGAKQAAE